MNPWEQYVQGDPRAVPTNWAPDSAPGATGWVYIGPAPAVSPTSTSADYNASGYGDTPYTGGGASTYYGGAASADGTAYGTGQTQTLYPASDFYAGAPASPMPAPPPVDATWAPPEYSGGYATEPAGDNFTVDAQRFAEYEQYLNDFNAGGLAPPPSRHRIPTTHHPTPTRPLVAVVVVDTAGAAPMAATAAAVVAMARPRMAAAA
jgi:hypothetical protein